MSCLVTAGIIVMTVMYVVIMTVAYVCFYNDDRCEIKVILLLKYEVFIYFNMFRICLTGFPSIPFHASAVCMQFHWCSLMMTPLVLASSLAIKGLFLFFKAFLTLSQI